MKHTKKKAAIAAAVAAEPAILTANTWFWLPSPSSGGRRNNEQYRTEEVANFLRRLGGRMYSESGYLKWVKTHNGETLTLTFSYRESARNVYKSLDIEIQPKCRRPRNSNITSLRKLYHLYRNPKNS